MITDKLLGEDLLTLLQERGKICVSVIVPTHRISTERRGDKIDVETDMEKAKQLLQYKYSYDDIQPILRNMDELLQAVDYNHNQKGLGFYVSPSIKMIVKFPFPVEEKIMVDKNFELRDLLYKVNFSLPYYVLLLTEKGVKLFEGSLDELNEIRDNNFPMEYEDEYIYSNPSRSTSYAGQAHVKSFEPDRSVIEEKRFTDFFRKVDDRLKDYMQKEIPLLLLGPKKELSWFINISDNAKHIIQKIPGSYNYSSLYKIAETAWPLVHNYWQGERNSLIKEFEEKIGEKLGISGIQQVWEAIKEGRAFKLLVEKDYRIPGFITANDYKLYLRPPKGHHRILPDVVDELIETVLEKNGKVFFTENDSLKDYQRIALITRY